MSRRYELSEAHYRLIEPMLPAERPKKQGRPYRLHRDILNGMFWILCSGSPWRDLPERYGPWKTVYECFRLWSQKGLIQRILGRLLDHLESLGQCY